MYIEGTTIHNEGVEIKLEHELKIRQIAQSIRALSPAAEINMKLLKCDKTFEVLLWGSVGELPIGIYSRGPTVGLALDAATKRVSNYCAKARAMRLSRKQKAAYAHPGGSSRLALAS